eukprot:358007-Chlamydomonas_euryale.AAC.6
MARWGSHPFQVEDMHSPDEQLPPCAVDPQVARGQRKPLRGAAAPTRQRACALARAWDTCMAVPHPAPPGLSCARARV